MKNNLQLAKNAKYEWRPEFKTSLAKSDIKVAIAELRALEDTYGEITPSLLVEHSKRKKSIFHNFFEWDNERAADSWRFMQARYLLGSIQVKVVKKGNPVRMPAYQITKRSAPKAGNTTYTRFDTLTQDNKMFILQQCLADLARVKNKLMANDFEDAIPYIDKAIIALQKESEIIPIESSLSPNKVKIMSTGK